MAAMNTADIGFEKEIWKAADKMRGNIDASEYKSVVLGLIFLKYISDKFEAKYQQLVAEGEGFEEDKDEYLSNKNEKGSYDPVFYVPAEARWEAIAIHAHSPEIGTIIDNAMRAIEKENKRLKDILPKNFARPELDKRRLGEVVDLFTNIRMHEHGDSKDILGRAYEYCLSKFAEAEGKLAGEFYTPACIVKTLVNVLQPYKGRVYDPCCGSGGMFVQSAQFIESHSGNINNISVYGQDSNPTTWKMAQMNLAIRGIEADLGHDLRHGQRVDDIRLSGLAELVLMLFVGVFIRPLDDLQICGGGVAGDRLHHGLVMLLFGFHSGSCLLLFQMDQNRAFFKIDLPAVRAQADAQRFWPLLQLQKPLLCQHIEADACFSRA